MPKQCLHFMSWNVTGQLNGYKNENQYLNFKLILYLIESFVISVASAEENGKMQEKGVQNNTICLRYFLTLKNLIVGT